MNETSGKPSVQANKKSRIEQLRRWLFSLLHKPATWLRRTITGIVTLIGLLSFLIVLPPRMSITPLDSPDTKKHTLGPFQLSNDGMFSLHDVSYRLAIDSVEDSTKAIVGRLSFEDTLNIPLLLPGDRTTFFTWFPVVLPTGIKSGNIYIWVTFRPDWWPFQRERWFRFTITHNSDGKPIWLQNSIYSESNEAPDRGESEAPPAQQKYK